MPNSFLPQKYTLVKRHTVRADIIKKEGSKIKLVEVKAKSIGEGDTLLTTKGLIRSEWAPYLFDVAFQKYVIENAFPSLQIEAGLMLADKSKVASVESLNQKFFLYDENKRPKVRLVGETDPASLGQEILRYVEADTAIKIIHQGSYKLSEKTFDFKSLVKYYSEAYRTDSVIHSDLGKKCNECEFRATDDQILSGYVSGYHKCWSEQASFTQLDFSTPHILEIWDFRKKDEYISNSKHFQKDLDRSDLEGKTPSKKDERGLSRVDRQEKQITKSQKNDPTQFIDITGLRKELQSFKFPLHFIDFETSAVAIPFNKGRRPYEQIAFQFSHHIIQKDGTIQHTGEWISREPGRFPNFDFIRNLKNELDKDDGTIFRYAAHENSILNAIYTQLLNSIEKDKERLCEWIKTITKSSSTQEDTWEGKMNMIDMRDLVLKYYYHPITKGSNSIKDILPAVLKESVFLKEKYSKPIYGNEIKSLNFKSQQWIQLDKNGHPINPYKLLPSVFEGVSLDQLDNLVVDEETGIMDGGAAMLAYAQMQFTQMSDKERDKITQALLRYCELDTLAMVMIWEAWNNWCS